MSNYDVNILNVGDADAIVINYCEGHPTECTQWITAVVDAGNVGDGKKIIPYIKHKTFDGTPIIDYAFCTHPDKDHKGGFFDLLENEHIIIKQFICYDFQKDLWSIKRKVHYTMTCLNINQVYNYPADSSKNLIAIAKKKGILITKWNLEKDFSNMPIQILGPSEDFYLKCLDNFTFSIEGFGIFVFSNSNQNI